MTWAVTYTSADHRGPVEHVQAVDPAWCRAAGLEPAETAEEAAWAVALVLGSEGDLDAQLIRVAPYGP